MVWRIVCLVSHIECKWIFNNFRSPPFFVYLTPAHCHGFRRKHEHRVQQNCRWLPIRCHISLLCCFSYVSLLTVRNSLEIQTVFLDDTSGSQDRECGIGPSWLLFLFTMAQQPSVGQGILIIEASRSQCILLVLIFYAWINKYKLMWSAAKYEEYARCEVLTAVLLKIQFFWDVTHCQLVNSHRRFDHSLIARF